MVSDLPEDQQKSDNDGRHTESRNNAHPGHAVEANVDPQPVVNGRGQQQVLE